ncbi:Sulfatase-like protein [Phytophthora palmivora]|uniref:Sulfatase-like protein n=1 Tax=Phytophthora palmivora TaxID=4796 RepID=A0A2P4XTX1_9STRA|nr:Sulfatase-like protein [Phytophthora palmivora]
MDDDDLHLDSKHATRCRFPELRVINSEITGAETITSRRPTKPEFRIGDVLELPWIGWFFVYAYVLFIFSFSRCATLKALVTMYTSPDDYTISVKAAVVTLGFLEDFVCTTYFACALWLFDTFKLSIIRWYALRNMTTTATIENIATFTGSWLLFFILMVPFASDMLLVVNRDMRFTFDVVAAMIRERDHLYKAPLEPEEAQRSYLTAVIVIIETTLFSVVRMRASWTDLTHWNPTQLVLKSTNSRRRTVKVNSKKSGKGVKYEEVALEEGGDTSNTSEDDSKIAFSCKSFACHHRVAIFSFVSLAILHAIVLALSKACPPLVAYSALNTPLNELFGDAFSPTLKEGTLRNVKTFIHPTEKHNLFASDSLYRRTTGFSGDLAFNVSTTNDNPPNVLVIGIESFRYQDSRYLVGEKDPSNLFNGSDISVTPNFDRWAKRGIVLRNMWSSLPTSRSVESLLFAQIPYDSTVKTGTSGGWTDTKLYGLPQLFTAKGYETFFTTGCGVTFDGWDSFFPAHGFETVWSNVKMIELAKIEMGITKDQWFGPEHRGFQWGVHDDISFKFLGDLLVNKTKEQREKMASGEKKKPLFLTHYTISSHVPFDSSPTWYEDIEKPDFSPLYEGKKHESAIKRYLNLRYFTDMELGKFLDRMSVEGILNDTIVVIMGDHGQAPEADLWNIHEDSVRRVASAIIAEGRLGEAAGLVIDDAAEQYDILNTLADITGVPDGGFVQHGVGRSLKRQIPFGERVVFANDPGYKMSIVRGHQRLRYDSVMDSMFLHDTEADHYIEKDLFPELSPKEQEEWMKWRDNGRQITAYYKKRWENKCFAIKC